MPSCLLARSLMLGTLLLLWTIPACGGSGGGSPPTPEPSIFDGRYSFVSIGARSVGASLVFAQTGQLTSDGQSEVTLAASFVNLNGSVVQASPGSATFTVDVQGTLSLFTEGGSELRGQISDDGALLALSAATAGSNPALFLGVRTSGSFGLGSLSGAYYVGIVRVTQAPEMTARFSSMTFNGAGGVPSIGSSTSNTNGTVFIAAGSADTGIYSVFADGSVSYAGAFGTFSGALLEGGEVGLLAGSVSGQPALMVLVKQATALDDTIFDGSYGTARLFFTGATETSFASLAGPSTADGLGRLTSTDLLVDRETALGAGFSRNAAYTVASDGRLSLSHLMGGAAEILNGNGAVQAQGRFGFCVGNNGPTDPPALEVYVRR